MAAFFGGAPCEDPCDIDPCDIDPPDIDIPGIEDVTDVAAVCVPPSAVPQAASSSGRAIVAQIRARMLMTGLRSWSGSRVSFRPGSVQVEWLATSEPKTTMLSS
jgi:hypothetical protein